MATLRMRKGDETGLEKGVIGRILSRVCACVILTAVYFVPGVAGRPM